MSERISSIRAHGKRINTLVDLGPDAVASGCDGDGTIAVWRKGVHDGGLECVVRYMEPHTKSINSLQLSHEKSHLASASDDGTVCVWRVHCLGGTDESGGLSNASADAENEGPLALVRRLDHGIRSRVSRAAVVSHNGVFSKVVSCGNDGSVCVNGNYIGRMESWIMAVQVALDGTQAVTASLGGGISVWDLTSSESGSDPPPPRVILGGSQVRYIMGLTLNTSPCADSPHKGAGPRVLLWRHSHLVSVGRDVVVWDTATWTPSVRRGIEHDNVCDAALLTSDEKTLLTVGGDGIKVWKWHDDGNVGNDAIAGNNSDSECNTTTQRNADNVTTETKEQEAGDMLVAHIPNPHAGDSATAMAITDSGTSDDMVVTGDNFGYVRMRSLRKVLAMVSAPAQHGGMGVRNLVASDDGTLVASGGNGDHSLIIWNVVSGLPLHHVKHAHAARIVEPIGFCTVKGDEGDDDVTCVLTSGRNEVRAWNTVTAVCVADVTHGCRHSDLTATHLNVDGCLLAASVSDHVWRWRVGSGSRPPVDMTQTPKHVTSIIVLDEDRVAVTCYKSNGSSPILIVDRRTGSVYRTLEPLDRDSKVDSGGAKNTKDFRFNSVALADHFVVGAGAKGLVCVWEYRSGALLHQMTLEDEPFLSEVWCVEEGDTKNKVAVLNSTLGTIWVFPMDLSCPLQVTRIDSYQLDVSMLWYPCFAGAFVVAMDKGNTIVVVSIALGQVIYRIVEQEPISALCLVAHRDGRYLSVGTKSGHVYMYKVAQDWSALEITCSNTGTKLA